MSLAARLLTALFSVMLFSCNLEKSARDFLPPEALIITDLALDRYLSGDASALRIIATDGFRSQATDEAFAKLFDYRGSGAVIDTAIIGAKVMTSTAAGTMVTVVYSVELDDRNLVVTIVAQKSGDDFALNGLHVNSAEKGAAGVPTLTFKGATIVHYLALALFAVIPLFILATLIACLRTKNVKRRILWSLFILFGVGTVTFNWTTGDLRLSLLQFHVLGVGVRILYDWVFYLGAPLGAILWWTMGRRAAADASASGSA